MLTLDYINFLRFFAFKKDIDASIVPSDNALAGIVVGSGGTFTQKVEAPVFESHSSELRVVRAPFLVVADFLQSGPHILFELFDFHWWFPSRTTNHD